MGAAVGVAPPPLPSLVVRALVQRVTRAEVRVADEVVGRVGHGLCVLVGVTHDDDDERVRRMATKLARLRIFADGEDKMNHTVLDVGGSVLVISQFTLYGDTAKGNRPSFVAAARPEHAEPLIQRLVQALLAAGVDVATGRFRADMAVELVNDGPVTVIVET